MTEPSAPTRTVVSLSRGSRACLLAALLVLLAATYRFLAPIDIPTPEGPMFRCGTAASPPTEAFPRSVCGRIATDRLMQAGFLAGGAIVLGLGGLVVFGATRRTEEATAPERRPHPHNAG
ncbi:MAG TPA: hypothetical protein VE547_09435 [Mycobacteriales bacterium]|nr:hypothetical protein [Mycobacteriales bacterium]